MKNQTPNQSKVKRKLKDKRVSRAQDKENKGAINQDEFDESSLVIKNFEVDFNSLKSKNQNKQTKKNQNLDQPIANKKRIVGFNDLKESLEIYLNQDEIDIVVKAYQYSKKAHEGQKRISGEDYYHHPLAVALILAEMKADKVSVITALLHDVVEDTVISKQDITNEFGKEVAEIVDGVSKLTQFKFNNIQDKQAGNFLKMVLAMCKDVRVMLVKVADRLHNMRTLDSIDFDKQRLKAKETLEIYAPISMRLGLSQIQYELEDLGLKFVYPDRYRVLSQKILEVTGGRENFVQDIESAIHGLLQENKIECKVFGRKKNLYSLYKKMRYKRVSFDQIEDTYAFRVIVKDAATCYQVLGLIHSFYTPIPKTVEDYIAMPKLNGYQSIHTEVIASFGVRIEVQLRTEEMNQIAEYGVAAHWRYKAKGSSDYEQNARNWLARVLETKEESEDPLDFMEKMKMDLQPHEVYTISPKGQILRMPYDSIGVDFAFAIHTDIGLKAVSMIVNGNHQPITTKLNSGQKIEIITSDKVVANYQWLFLVKTAKAKNAISTYFKKINKTNLGELKLLGKNMLNIALARYSKTSFKDLSATKIETVLRNFNLINSDEIFLNIAQGKLIAKTVAKKLLSANFVSRMMTKLGIRNKKIEPHDFLVSAKKKPLAQFARCCGPIPGDVVVSEIKPNGYYVHRRQCKTILKKLSKNPEQCVLMKWDLNASEHTYRTTFRIIIKNESDAFTKITSMIGANGADIENIRHTTFNYKTRLITCVIWIHSLKELDELTKAIASYSFVKSINRNN